MYSKIDGLRKGQPNFIPLLNFRYIFKYAFLFVILLLLRSKFDQYTKAVFQVGSLIPNTFGSLLVDFVNLKPLFYFQPLQFFKI